MSYPAAFEKLNRLVRVIAAELREEYRAEETVLSISTHLILAAGSVGLAVEAAEVHLKLDDLDQLLIEIRATNEELFEYDAWCPTLNCWELWSDELELPDA